MRGGRILAGPGLDGNKPLCLALFDRGRGLFGCARARALVHLDAVAQRPAEHLVNRHARCFAREIPQGLLHAG